MSTTTSTRARSTARSRRSGRLGVWPVIQPVVAILAVILLIGFPLWMVLVTSAKPQSEALNPNEIGRAHV